MKYVLVNNFGMKYLHATDLKHAEVFIEHLHSTLHIVIIIDLQKQSKKKHNIFYEKASTLAITLLNVLTIKIKHF